MNKEDSEESCPYPESLSVPEEPDFGAMTEEERIEWYESYIQGGMHETDARMLVWGFLATVQ